MRLPENDTDDRLDLEVERELAAVEKALAGEPIDPEFAELTTLAADLAAERPEPSDEWALEMDAKAGAGFGSSRLGSLRRLLPGGRGGGRRRGALTSPGGPLGAAAALMVVIVVGVGIGISQQGSDDSGGGEVLGEPELLSGDRETGSSAEAPPPNQFDRNSAYDRSPAEEGTTSAAAPEAGFRAGDLSRKAEKTAPGKNRREQDRNASLALKTGTEEVRSVSDQAIQITEAAGGVVLNSELRERAMDAVARMQLQVPTRELDSTLDQLTDLATVASLNEISEDITRPFVSAQDRLDDAQAERTELLKALGNATTDEEIDALRGQLKDVRREISRAESAFNNIARRARTSSISLQVNGSPDGGGDGSWSLSDAADDALSALKTVAGVLLIAAAILAPLAILIAIAAVITRSIRRTRRERALDE